jgi:hypothetical protein
MRFHPHTTALWQSFVLGVLFSLWFGLFGLLIIAHGDLEAFLHETFRHSRLDAFSDLNRVFVLFWVVHSSLTITAVAAARSRRLDVSAILLIGPAFGLAISLLWQRWGDPNWAVFVGVCLIGWLVGTVVGGVYWFITSHRTEPPPAGS